jgi:lipopolysaccharide biosynthesis regulator YciM
LLSGGNAARQLAGARIQFEAERVFAAAAAVPDAPPSADRALREVQNQAQVAVDTLQEVARGSDKLLAARALVLLAEREANFKNPAEAARLLRLAIAMEPNESGLRVALADALIGTAKKDEAVATRDALVREVPVSSESLRRAASLSLRLNQPARAVELAQSAQRFAQVSPANTPADGENASCVLARAIWAYGIADRAEELYKKLTLPQWPTADRAAALLDWIASLRATNREADAARQQTLLDGLGATEGELKDAHELLDSL